MKVGVIGAGTMGTGIAWAFAEAFAKGAGSEVYLCDLTQEFADRGKGRIEAALNALVAKEKIGSEEADAVLRVIRAGTVEICTDIDLVVEATLEDLEIKRQSFKALEKVVPKSCIFTTNTSSLSITELSQGLSRPVVGMHFFNPANRMRLVEVIGAISTPPELIKRVKEIAVAIEKEPIEVAETPGFVVNRLVIPMINEAIGLYAEGVASVKDIDTALKLGANHPLGPLELGDLVGLDIVLAIMDVLFEETKDSKYRAHGLLRKMVRGNMLGKKTGKGFYDY
jgi:3-hydroxybutyryl-CoA dehydrogenase